MKIQNDYIKLFFFMALGSLPFLAHASENTNFAPLLEKQKINENQQYTQFDIDIPPRQLKLYYNPIDKKIRANHKNEEGEEYAYIIDLEDKKIDSANKDDEENQGNSDPKNYLLLKNRYNVDTTTMRQKSEHFRPKLPQPFGPYKIFVRLNEKTYTDDASPLNALDIFVTKNPVGTENNHKTTYGSGKLQVLLETPKGLDWLITQNYQNNNIPININWSPDGKYVFAQTPAETNKEQTKLIIFGPFTSLIGQQNILQAIHKNETHTDYMAGKIDAAAYFGQTYDNALRKIQRCDSITEIIGDIENIELKSKEPTQIKSASQGPIGLNFDFFVTGTKGASILSVAAFNDAESENNQNYIDLIGAMMHLKFKGEHYRFDKNCNAIDGF